MNPWPSYPAIPTRVFTIDDADRVDTPTVPKKMERVWNWECEEFKHPQQAQPGKLPEKCPESVKRGWFTGPCGDENFHKTGESEREVK